MTCAAIELPHAVIDVVVCERIFGMAGGSLAMAAGAQAGPGARGKENFRKSGILG